ncbi:APC family permease [Microbacterium panaciterrae]|uniref:APC family permease n=2 Tax=Microbacterium panaciterrae TaxID=985759 RepID=A0ABP8PA66_9MICO
MGVLDIVFSVLAFNAPMSVFVGFITVIIGFGNGIGTPLVFIATGILMLLFAVGFTTMSRDLPNPGAFYAYITAGLGRPVGLGSAFVALVSYVFILVGGYCFGGISWQSLIHDRFGGPDIPWWVYTLATVIVVSILGYFHINLSAKVLMIFMILESIVMVAYDVFVIARGGDGGTAPLSLAPLNPANAFGGSIGLAIIFGVVCFSGFEATAVFREEARTPEKTVPRATYAAIIFLMVLYALTAWAMINGIGVEHAVKASAADPTGAAFATAEVYLSKIGVDVVNLLLCTSIFAANLAAHNVSTRYIYSLSVDRIFPGVLASVHKKQMSPHRASTLVSAITVVSIGICVALNGNPSTLYATLVGIGGYALILLLLLTSIGIVVYFRRKPGIKARIAKTVVAPVLAMIGLAVAFVIATQNVDVMIGGSVALAIALVALFFVLLAAGIVVALILKRFRPSVYARIGRQDV